jgi:hypothetical protein
MPVDVWGFDAAALAETDDIDGRPVYKTSDIEAFLNFERSDRRVIAGLKGTGKTLFLKLTSHHYRRSLSHGFTLIPAEQLTERLYSVDHDFSAEKATVWGSPERWKHVWRTVLSVVVLKALRAPIAPEVIDLFPGHLGFSIGAHLSVAVKSRAVATQRFQELFSDHLDAGVQAISHGVAVFVDNIDEALARHAGRALEQHIVDPRPQSGTHSYDIWRSAQIGFLLATRELTDRNSHLKIYGTVRTEAIRDNPEPTAFNLGAYILDLGYSSTELRHIFSTKLKALKALRPDAFARPDVADPISAFFPFDQITHPTVEGPSGTPLTEGVFEYLRRHTRGRPRELDFLGRHLDKIPPQDRSEKNVRDVVRTLSAQFFDFARNEAVPFWDSRIDDLLALVTSNFISRRDAARLAGKIGSVGEALWEALRANGMCGAVLKDHPDGTVQLFSQHGGPRELSAQDFRAADRWVIHPCASIATQARRKRYTPHPHCVAGHELAFAEKTRRKHVHLLIGAGRLGLGLVVPTLLKDAATRVLVCARWNEKRWDPMLSAAQGGSPVWLTIRCRSLSGATRRPDERIPIQLVEDAGVASQHALRRALRRSRCVVLVYRTREVLHLALQLADSVGVSVGRERLEDVARDIVTAPMTRARTVLAYENDETKVDAAARLLAPGGYTVAPTVVDRICPEVQFSDTGIVVEAETHGEIAAYLPNGASRVPGCFGDGAGKEARRVKTREEFLLLREKKKRLVNSLHFAAAALGWQALKRAGADRSVTSAKIMGLVSGNMEIAGVLDGLRDVMVLAVLSAGNLLTESMDATSLANTVRELDAYGQGAIRRIQDSYDALSRVLNGDPKTVNSKYTRLFADVEHQALAALVHPTVRKLFPGMDKSEISGRLAALKEAIITLLGPDGQDPTAPTG